MSKRSDYPLFNHWINTTDWVIEYVARMPKYIRPILGARILNYTLDICDLLSLAIYQKERKVYLQEVNQKIDLLRVLIRISHRRQFLSTRQYAYISEELDKAGRMLGGWLKHSH